MADTGRYKQSNNPILSKYEKVDADKNFEEIIANAGLGEPKVTLNDVIVKSTIMFGITVVFAVIGWNVAADMPMIWIGAAIIGLVLGLVNAFKKKISVPLMLAYAVVQGVMLGGISNWYNQYAAAQDYQGLVLQAVIGTMTAFGVMLFLYGTGIVKVGGKFKKVMFAALISYGLIGIVSLIASLFGVGGGWGFYGVSGIGLLLCAAGVLLASFTLLLDFDAIKEGIAMGLPEKESWRMAFGLELTLIWLYLEILRLLAIVSGRE